MNYSLNEINKILDSESKEEKIKVLESLYDTNDPKIILKIISMLDDPDIEVRGEAFSSLILNENNISEFLIQNLDSDKKNVRGFSTLILANRKNFEGVSSIIKLTKDPSSMVRSCALGALGFLKADEASKAIHACIFDSNLEVKKSAIKAAIDLGDKIPIEELDKNSKEKDEELEKLLLLAKQN